jgi:hypothetical protein
MARIARIQLSSSRKIAAFVAFTFVASWSAAISFWAIGGEWGSPASAAVWRLFTLPPAFGALIVKGAIARDPLIEQLAISLRPNRWWLVAWLLPVAAAALAWLLGGLFPSVELVTDLDSFVAYFAPRLDAEQLEAMREDVEALGFHPVLRMLMQAMVAGITLNAVTALGEELGWRGLLHHELRAGFWTKSSIIGLVWGVWHAPLVLQGLYYPDHPVAGVVWVVAFCVVWAPIFTYVRVRAGSIFATCIMSGTLVAVHELPLVVTRGGDDVTAGTTAAPGIASAALVLMALWAFDRHVAAEPLMSGR